MPTTPYDSTFAYDSLLSYGAYALSISVGGTDVSGLVLTADFAIAQVLTRRGDTATFTVVDATRSMVFPPLQAVRIVDADGNVKFAGVTTIVKQSVPDGPVVNLWNFQCQDWTLYLQKRLCNKKYQATSIDAIVKDLLASFPPGVAITTAHVQTGLPVLAYFNANHLRLSDAFDKLVRLSDTTSFLMWDVDPNQDLHFYDQDHAQAADVVLTDAQAGSGQANYSRDSFYYQRDASQLTNQITFRGGTFLSNPYTQNWVGNGSQSSYVFDYPPDTTTEAGGSIPVVSVGGAPVATGLDSGTGFGSNLALVSLAQDSQTWTLRLLTPPGAGQAISAVYVYDIPVLIRRKDNTSVLTYDAAFEEYVVDTTIKSQQVATQRAGSLLSQYAKPLATAQADVDATYVGTLGAGQEIQLVNTQLGLNVTMLVTDCTIRGMPGGKYQHSLQLAQYD